MKNYKLLTLFLFLLVGCTQEKINSTEQNSKIFGDDSDKEYEEFRDKQNSSDRAISGIDGTTMEVVYSFMRRTYEDLTDFGNNYIPEVHDPQVAELAAEKYGITKEEAAKIYEFMEMNKDY